jgi:uncharacterized membrane protein YkoI
MHMKRLLYAASLTLVAMGLSVSPGWALFESNKELSDQARVSMTDAIKTAEQTTHGKAVEVNMGKDDGRVVYKIETVDGTKKTRKVYVDAVDGKIHEVK